MQDKHIAFVLQYLRDFNATKAAIRAGYSPKTAGQIGNNLLKREDVKQAIQDKLEEAEVTTFRILGELTKIAYADMGDYGKVHKGGEFEAYAFDDLEPGSTRAIKKVKEKRKILEAKGEEDGVVIDNQFEFELHDKMKALELLGKYKNLWDKQQTTTVNNITVQPASLSYTQFNAMSEDEKLVYLATGELPGDISDQDH